MRNQYMKAVFFTQLCEKIFFDKMLKKFKKAIDNGKSLWYNNLTSVGGFFVVLIFSECAKPKIIPVEGGKPLKFTGRCTE